MTKKLGERVVVLGAGLGGLVATQVLSRFFTEVVLVERDRLTSVEDAPRRGVPQGRHAHGLVARGQQLLEGLFPGLADQLSNAGIVSGDLNSDIRWYFNGARLRPVRTGLVSIPATRPVLEHHVRLRVLSLLNLKLVEDTDIAGLTMTPDHRRVTGVRIRRVTGVEELAADLVVDTSGRGSRTPVWLTELGYERPEEDQVRIGLAYTTQHFRLTHDPLGTDVAIIPAATPSHPRGAFFYRLPGVGGGFELSLTGMLGDHPPADPEGFMAFTRTLPVPEIYKAVQDAEPLDEPVMLRYPASTRRRYDRLTRFPERFLVMADAVCSFNPLYAQGMTVAALEAVTLGGHLEKGIPSALPFFRDIAKDIEQPWQFSATADLAYPGVEGRRTMRTRVVNAYLPKLQAAAVHDLKLSAAFIRVAGLIDPPQALLRPDILARVLRLHRPGRRRSPSHTTH